MGLSFGKLLLLAIVVFAVWYAVKRPSLIEAVTRTVRRELKKSASPRPAAGPPKVEAEDLVKCGRCGAYVAKGTGCGRPDCPQNGRPGTGH